MTKKFIDGTGLTYLWRKIKQNFVAKESGRGLSTNDFTTADKNKVDTLSAITLPTEVSLEAGFIDPETKSYTVSAATLGNCGSFPRLIVLDEDGMETAPEGVMRSIDTGAVTVIFTSDQFEQVESGRKLTLIFIH